MSQMQRPPLPIAALQRQVRRIAKSLREEALSYKVVYNIVRASPADLLVMAHHKVASVTRSPAIPIWRSMNADLGGRNLSRQKASPALLFVLI